MTEKFQPPMMGYCTVCGKERLALPIRSIVLDTTIYLCDACSYVLREEWNDIKMLRIPVLDPKIAVTYIAVPRLLPNRSELDVSGYEFIASSRGMGCNWPVTSYNPDRRELCKWLSTTLGIVTWPKAVTRIYAGFDAMSRFAEVVLLPLWGLQYEPAVAETKFDWLGFASMISPESTKGAFVIGAKAGFEGFLMRRELAPAATMECTVLSEPAIRYMATKRGDEKRPMWSSGSMTDAYFQAMTSKEKLVVGQLLGMQEEEPAPVVEAKVVEPARASKEKAQQSLSFDPVGSPTPSDREEGVVDLEDDGNGGMAVVRGPLEPEDDSEDE